MFALVDCNNFYVSCERVFNPLLRDRACVVLSSNDGCIVSRSAEVKKKGIPMGAPYHKWRTELESINTAICSSNYTLYGDMSQRVMSLLSEFAPRMEVYSIDEAFLDLGSIEDFYFYGSELRQKLMQFSGIPVSVGIAPTKVLAKVANKVAKDNPSFQVFVITKDILDEVLANIEVSDIWSVGWRSAELLRKHGVYTALDLKNKKDSWIRKHLKIFGLRVAYELRGESCLPIKEFKKDKKGILCSRSFGSLVSDFDSLERSLAIFVSRAAEKLRKQGSLAGSLGIFIKTNKHRKDMAQYSGEKRSKILSPTADTRELIQISSRLLEQIYKPEYKYKRAGVFLADLISESCAQISFIERNYEPRSIELMSAIDLINKRHGKQTLNPAVVGSKPSLHIRHNFSSKRYTTFWDDLPLVK